MLSYALIMSFQVFFRSLKMGRRNSHVLLNKWRVAIAIFVICLIFGGLFEYTSHNSYHFASPFLLSLSSPPKANEVIGSWCLLPPLPGSPSDASTDSQSFTDVDSRKRQVERLNAAMNVATQSFEDSGDVLTDPRWNVFNDLHEVLMNLFPPVHVFYNRYLLSLSTDK